MNSDDRNSDDRNSDDRNSGDRNSDDRNSGDVKSDDRNSDSRGPQGRRPYDDIAAAVDDWREGRLGWAALLDRIETAASRLSPAAEPQREELLWRVQRLQGLGAAPADGRAPAAPARLVERELKQITNVGPDWQPPPPRQHRTRSVQWLAFAGLLAAYGCVDLFFGKTSLAALAFAIAAVFAALAYGARLQERRRPAVQAGQAVQALRTAPPTSADRARGPATRREADR